MIKIIIKLKPREKPKQVKKFSDIPEGTAFWGIEDTSPEPETKKLFFKAIGQNGVITLFRLDSVYDNPFTNRWTDKPQDFSFYQEVNLTINVESITPYDLDAG